MRKVYQAEKTSLRLIAAIGFSATLTAVLFGILPFAHQIAAPERSLELRRASAADVPPPIEEQPIPPSPEAEEPPEASPEPQLVEAVQQIPLSADLEVAMGSGGALAGFGEVRSAITVEEIQQDTFDVSELEKRPEAVSQTPPSYPPDLRKARIAGVVTLVFILNEEGRVEDPRVENSSRPEFEKPALEAIRKWRFRPGMKDGQPVRTYIRQAMRFNASG